jgi:hypothetical protein
MLDMMRREFIALVGGGGLLLATKVKRARAQRWSGFFVVHGLPMQATSLLASTRA